LLQTPGDGSCFFHAVLHLVTHPAAIDAVALRRQLAVYCLMNPHQITPYFSLIAAEAGTYENWVRTILCTDTWADETMIIALSHMLNVSITLIMQDGVFRIQHTMEEADLYIVGNGSYRLGDNSHFTAARMCFPYILPAILIFLFFLFFQ